VEAAVRCTSEHVQHNNVLTRQIAALHPDYFDGGPDASQRF
ncbi:MAG: hypothetical protein RLZZ177_3072, partial [Pseudomonadota bacterium]